MLRKHAMKVVLSGRPTESPCLSLRSPLVASCDQAWLGGLSWAEVPRGGLSRFPAQPSVVGGRFLS